MLYDPKWEKREVKADPFSLEALIAWLEKQPTENEYCWLGMSTCLLAKWTQSIDPTAHPTPYDRSTSFKYVVNGKTINLEPFSNIACSVKTRDTFGAALERARAAAR